MCRVLGLALCKRPGQCPIRPEVASRAALALRERQFYRWPAPFHNDRVLGSRRMYIYQVGGQGQTRERKRERERHTLALQPVALTLHPETLTRSESLFSKQTCTAHHLFQFFVLFFQLFFHICRHLQLAEQERKTLRLCLGLGLG